MIGEHLQVLFLKCSLAMVFQLAVDICRHCIHFGGTYCERAVAVLPMKLQTRALFFIDVFAGVRLNLSHKISNRDFSGNAKEQMSMVIEASNPQGMSLQIAGDPSHVTPDTIPEIIFTQ